MKIPFVRVAFGDCGDMSTGLKDTHGRYLGWRLCGYVCFHCTYAAQNILKHRHCECIDL